MSKSVSPTGVTTTTVTTESSSPSGGTTTETTTTSSSTSSTSSSSSSSNDEISFTTILDEIASLTNQQSETLAQQQTAQIGAISEQASYTLQQAALDMTGANSMMMMAGIGLAVSMGTTGMGVAGIGSASKEADEAETQAMQEQEQTLSKSSETSLSEVKTATNPATSTKDSLATAQRSVTQLKLSAKELLDKGTLSKPQADSINQQAEALQKAIDHAKYQGVENPKKQGWIQPTDETGAPLKNGEGIEITNPELAIAHYNQQAEDIQDARNASPFSLSKLSEQGIKPGRQISDDEAKAIIQSGWSKEQSEVYNKAPQEDKQKMLDEPAAELKNSINSVKLNRNSEAWQRAYSNSYNKTQLYTGLGLPIANVFNSAGQAENQIYQAKGQEAQAAAQVAGSTDQAMSTGISQTNQIADQLRQSMNTIASYMAQDASQKM